MKIDIYNLKKVYTPEYLGYIETESDLTGEDLAAYCWNMCNWFGKDKKPEELHSSISSCDHGICFKFPNGENWLALSHGWLKGTSLEVSGYARRHESNLIWLPE